MENVLLFITHDIGVWGYPAINYNLFLVNACLTILAVPSLYGLVKPVIKQGDRLVIELL